MTPEHIKFPKIPRLSREIIVTEKIDGTNACIYVPKDGGPLIAGSRNRWISVEKDNFGFAKWVKDNECDLNKLGPGIHYGEWYGCGIQRGYGLNERRFALFNVSRWGNEQLRPKCCGVVPILGRGGDFNSDFIGTLLGLLIDSGSQAVPGYMNPEGIVVFHTAANVLFKKTIEGDEKPLDK